MYNLSKKTKIICTIGPASDNKETLEKLLAAGKNSSLYLLFISLSVALLSSTF